MSDTANADASGPTLGWMLAALGVVAALSVSFFLVDVPPVLDYPNHLARYVVLAHPHDPVLSAMYQPNWRVLPNLGLDIVGASLLGFMRADIGGRLILAISLFAPVAGAVAYSRAAFGRFAYWPLGSAIVAYNGVFFLGFMNFSASVGLAFAAAAVWIGCRARRPYPATVICEMAMIVIFFCHIFGAALFALLVATHELARLWQLRKQGRLSGPEILFSVAAVALIVSPALVLYALSGLSGGAASAGEWRVLQKLWRIFTPFMTTSVNLTLATAVIVVSFVVLAWRRAMVAQGARMAALVLLVLFVAAPSTFKGGTFVDARLATMLGFLVFAGMLPVWPRHMAIACGVAFAALIGIRASYVAATWFDHRHDVRDVRAAIAPVEAGARVLVARGHPGNDTDATPAERALPGMYRLDGNLAALLTIERRAFWPLLFASAAQQPLVVREPFMRLALPLTEPVDWPLLNAPVSPELASAAPYLKNWRDDFHYVLLIDAPSPLTAPDGLSQIYAGPYAVLYRIDGRAR